MSNVLDELRQQIDKNITKEEVLHVEREDPQIACGTMRGIQIRLALGLEFAVEYKDKTAFITGSPTGGKNGYFVISNGEIEFQADTIDDFKNATLGGEKIKDIADKWEITWSA